MPTAGAASKFALKARFTVVSRKKERGRRTGLTPLSRRRYDYTAIRVRRKRDAVTRRVRARRRRARVMSRDPDDEERRRLATIRSGPLLAGGLAIRRAHLAHGLPGRARAPSRGGSSPIAPSRSRSYPRSPRSRPGRSRAPGPVLLTDRRPLPPAPRPAPARVSRPGPSPRAATPASPVRAALPTNAPMTAAPTGPLRGGPSARWTPASVPSRPRPSTAASPAATAPAIAGGRPSPRPASCAARAGQLLEVEEGVARGFLLRFLLVACRARAVRLSAHDHLHQEHLLVVGAVFARDPVLRVGLELALHVLLQHALVVGEVRVAQDRVHLAEEEPLGELSARPRVPPSRYIAPIMPSSVSARMEARFRPPEPVSASPERM